MHITYITHTRFPVQKAHGKQIAEVCSALAKIGHRVTLLCPTMTNIIRKDPFSYYGVPKKFTVEYLKHFDATAHMFVPGFFHMRVNMWCYGKALRHFFKNHPSTSSGSSAAANRHAPGKTDLLYVRTSLLLPVLLKTGIPVIFEIHALPRRGKRRFAKLCTACTRVVCLTHLQREEIVAWGVPAKKIVVEADGVDLSRFAHVAVKKNARGFHDGVPIVGYVGSFTTQKKIAKGIDVILEALARLRLQKVPVHAVLAGGWGSEVDDVRRDAKRLGIADDVLVHGHMPAGEVPMQLLACDFLIYPAPASQHPYFQRDTSPLKLFEYLAAGKPIICADLPPLREVVTKQDVFFFTPGDPVSLAHWIAHALKHPKESADRAARGKRLVRKYTWEERMKRVLRSIQQ